MIVPENRALLLKAYTSLKLKMESKHKPDDDTVWAGAFAALGIIAAVGLVCPFGELTENSLLPKFLYLLSSSFGGFLTAALCERNQLRYSLATWLQLTVFAIASSFISHTLKDGGYISTQTAEGWWWVFSLSIGFVILGAKAHHRLETWSRISQPRRKWDYITKDGKAIVAHSPWKHKVMARIWFGLFIVFMLSSLSMIIFQVKSFYSAGGRAGGVLTIMFSAFTGFLASAFACRTLAARNVAPSVDELLKRDVRKPIVYLRAFQDQQLHIYSPRWLLGYEVPWKNLLCRSLEERLAKAVSRHGPFVAIGRPGENLPPVGAARMYVDNDDWQTVVVDLLEKCQMVIIQLTYGEGLEWEIERVSKIVAPEKIVFFTPISLEEDEIHWRERSYRCVRDWANKHFDNALPEKIDNEFFIAFRKPDYLSAPINKKWVAIDSNSKVPDEHLNRQILIDLAHGQIPRQNIWQRPVTPNIILIAFIALAAWIALLLGLAWLLVS